MTLLNKRYQLQELIGRGGTAAVYKTRDTALNITRALKLLQVPENVRGQMRTRLLSEARAMARISHPHVLEVYDICVTEEADFVVMELAPFGSLSDKLNTEGPLSPELAIQYTLQILSALEVAHNHNIIHRDIKPQNILLIREDHVALADFGIVLQLDQTTRHTQTGVAMGSLCFMAPEQRIDARSVCHRADLYAVATTLYTLLTNANPVDIFVLEDDSPRWLDIPPALKEIIQRGTQYRPTDRYPSAAAMLEALKAAQVGSEFQNHSTPPLEVISLPEDAHHSHTLVPPTESLSATTQASIANLSPRAEAEFRPSLLGDTIAKPSAETILPPPPERKLGLDNPPIEPEDPVEFGLKTMNQDRSGLLEELDVNFFQEHQEPSLSLDIVPVSPPPKSSRRVGLGLALACFAIIGVWLWTVGSEHPVDLEHVHETLDSISETLSQIELPGLGAGLGLMGTYFGRSD